MFGKRLFGKKEVAPPAKVVSREDELRYFNNMLEEGRRIRARQEMIDRGENPPINLLLLWTAAHDINRPLVTPLVR